jgi:hypothetical protein
MRRLWTSLLTLCLLVVSMGTGATTASAATPVTIGKIASKTAPYGKKITVKPKVSHAKNAVASAKLTVKKKSGRTIAKNKSSVKLSAGTYRVTTSVRYKTFRTTTEKRTTTKRVLTVAYYESTPVTCVPTRVDVITEGWVSLDGTCTGAAFSGKVTLSNLDAFEGEPWWGLDDDYNELEFSAPPQVGTAFSATLTPGDDLYKNKSVTTTVTKKVWSSVKTKTKTQTLVVKAGKKPNHTAPYSSGECPSWAPIKGNGNSGIYHVPGGRWYDVTYAEECFTTASAARAHGYRASRNG